MTLKPPSNTDALTFFAPEEEQEAEHGKIAICFLDGEFTVKRLHITKNTITLMPENDSYKPIKVSKDNDLLIWGIVTYVIKAV